MLIGEAQAFYFPNGTVYATVFDPHPLELLIRQDPDPAAVLRGLRRMGVTHLYFDWGEILRLASTYGYPPDLSWGLIEAREAGKPPTLPILEQLAPLGLKLYRQIDRQGAPPITIYELPAAP